MLTERQLQNRLKKLEALEKDIAEKQKELEALKEEIKAEMQDTEVLTVGGYVVRYATVVSNKLDTAAIKKNLPDVYKMYSKETSYKRFTVTAAK